MNDETAAPDTTDDGPPSIADLSDEGLDELEAAIRVQRGQLNDERAAALAEFKTRAGRLTDAQYAIEQERSARISGPPEIHLADVPPPDSTDSQVIGTADVADADTVLAGE